jgi:hypothetical protein
MVHRYLSDAFEFCGNWNSLYSILYLPENKC